MTKVLATKDRADVAVQLVARHCAFVGGRPVGDVTLFPGHVGVASVVQNSEEYVTAFINYYLDAGFEHVLLVDNGSDDETISLALARAAATGRVTVLSCSLPYRDWEVALKHFASQLLGSGGAWVVIADHDEFFYFPGMADGRKRLNELVTYLDLNGHSVVLTQQVDLLPATQHFAEGKRICLADHRFFDVAAVRFEPYREFMEQAGTALKFGDGTERLNFMLNGTRHQLFGLRRPLWLSKHAMIRPSLGPWLMHPHLAYEGHVADVACALLHFPFTAGFRRKVLRVVDERRLAGSSGEEYLLYSKTVRNSMDLRVAGPDAIELLNRDDLLQVGVLHAPSRYWTTCMPRREAN